MAAIFPEITPFDTVFLDVSEGHRLHVTLAGNPAGRPAVLLHGGPGSGLSATARCYFNPALYRIIQFDQRGCGKSTPNAAGSLAHNTTHHLVDDMEAIRSALEVNDWLVYGSSWGATLALAYAQRHPKRVRAMVLAGVTTTRQKEIDWLYKGLAMFLPQQWQRFIAAIPDHLPKEDPVGAYYRLLNDSDPAIRAMAALEWHLWEAGSISAQDTSAFPEKWRDDDYILARARLCAHYFHHAAWLEDGVLLRDAGVLTGIPGIFIQGMRDLQGPPVTAYELAAAWPGSELIAVDGAGHSTGDVGMEDAILSAIARFAN
ncbi:MULTISPECIES: prolyl aminopeptidase [unclassified Agrobacterium]|uniref:prolyl aminopeptidase n=1 Tax=unclassified Agrobacterium TaxID=2632611 RepID=UPI00244D11E7|nr:MULTISPECIES: prolyl aminopeptidase [unclassified Agrobacterium]MDH0616811.1 prolyl aminopeptidase [Agrobacterium sp. GD03872]MDH0698139.1 prolyl aminopeptidase [Agrobacterium sp. GD03871]MDH1062498.1 prolyl aminopeptidase [Agrobacterium sp. GD03992]MDH2211744.1 prolyl aminopeptidase [Agrobacterium sp. GD03643]MDH2222421.1 prolyl aminopeptidase [Agrobacterium sp. GD03638]